MAQARTNKAERKHILEESEHFELLAGIFASIAEQGKLTEEVMQLGGFKALQERGMA